MVGDRSSVGHPEEVETRHRHAGRVGAVVEDLEVERTHALGSRAAGTSSRCDGSRRCPRYRPVRPVRPVRSCRFGAPLRPPCCWPPAPRAPVEFSKDVARGVERRIDRARDSMPDRSRVLRHVGVEQCLATFVHPRPVGRNGQLDRGGLVLVAPTPADGARWCWGARDATFSGGGSSHPRRAWRSEQPSKGRWARPPRGCGPEGRRRGGGVPGPHRGASRAGTTGNRCRRRRRRAGPRPRRRDIPGSCPSRPRPDATAFRLRGGVA